jgi:hypothetical protein
MVIKWTNSLDRSSDDQSYRHLSFNASFISPLLLSSDNFCPLSSKSLHIHLLLPLAFMCITLRRHAFDLFVI